MRKVWEILNINFWRCHSFAMLIGRWGTWCCSIGDSEKSLYSPKMVPQLEEKNHLPTGYWSHKRASQIQKLHLKTWFDVPWCLSIQGNLRWQKKSPCRWMTSKGYVTESRDLPKILWKWLILVRPLVFFFETFPYIESMGIPAFFPPKKKTKLPSAENKTLVVNNPLTNNPDFCEGIWHSFLHISINHQSMDHIKDVHLAILCDLFWDVTLWNG